MIIIALVVMIAVVIVIRYTGPREQYITLQEVISGARIISYEEGIIESKGVRFILGTHDLKKRKNIIEYLDLRNLKASCIVDLRFDTQVIIKEGSGIHDGS